MYLIKRSLYLIIFYIAVALFTCLSFSSLITSYADTKVIQNGLTKNAVQLVIAPDSSGAVSSLTNEQFIERLKEKSKTFVLFKDEDNLYAKSTYLHHVKFPLLADSDRSQSPELFPENHVILDDSLMTSTTVRNDKRLFLYQGRSYEVLDSFVWVNKYMYRDSNIFLSLDLERPAYGTFLIDGISESNLDHLLSKWHSERPEDFVYTVRPSVSGFLDRLILSLRDQAFIVMVFGICMLLMMISTLGTTLSWVQAKKDEIQARHLVGASSVQLRFWLLRQYSCILLFSFILGNILAWLIAKWGIFDSLIRDVTLFGSFVSLLFCFVIGILTALISTARYDKRMRTRKKGVLS